MVALNYAATPTKEDGPALGHYAESEPQTPSTGLNPSRRPSDHDEDDASPIAPMRPIAAKTKKALGPEDFELDLESGRQRAVRLDSVGIDEDGERRQRTVRHSQMPSKLSS